MLLCCCFVNDTATTEIYSYGHTLSLHDALPISSASRPTPCLGCLSTPSPGAPLRGRDARRGARRWACAPPSICCKRATAAKRKKKAIVQAVTQPYWLSSVPRSWIPPPPISYKRRVVKECFLSFRYRCLPIYFHTKTNN